MTSCRKSILSIAIGAVLSAEAGHVGAQEAAAPDNALELEEIVVTARRVAEPLQETPISVSAFRAEDLEKMGAVNIGDTAMFTPGFTTTAGPTGQNAGFFFIRGVGQVDLNPATDPGVATYIDGVYLGRVMGASFDTLDIDRVEVLRGPQGTLFGRNSMGGALNVITHTPDGSTGGNFTVFGGDYDTYGAKGRIDFPLGETLAGSVTAMYRNAEGWGTRVFDGQTLPDSETKTARAKFVWRPNENFTATLAGDITRVDGTAQDQVLIGFNAAAASPLGVPIVPEIGESIVGDSDFYNNYSTNDPRFEQEVNGVSLALDWTLGTTGIKSITSYRDLKEFSANDFDGSPYTFYDGYFDTDQHQFSQELQLTGETDRLGWLLGAYYYTEEADHTNAISMGGNNGCLPVPPIFIPPGNMYPSCFVTGQPYATAGAQRYIRNNQQIAVDVEALAAFAHLNIKLSDRWSASLGLRWTDEQKQQDYNFFIDNSRNVANFAGIPPIVLPTFSPDNPFLTVPTSYEKSWTDTTPAASLEFRPVDDVMLYLSYAQGFKSGGFNGRPNPNQQGQFNTITPYDPEKLETYELGLKSQFAQNRVRLNAAAFFSTYKDIQLLVLGPSGFFDTENAAESEIKGIEVELQALLTSSLEVQASIATNDNEYTELDPGTIASGITTDDRLPLTPELTYSLAATYTANFTGGATLAMRADYSWRDDVYYGATNNPLEFQEGFGLLGARATYTLSGGRFSVTAFGRNLTDEKYYSNGQDVVGPLGVAFAAIGAPRMWGLEATMKFGD